MADACGCGNEPSGSVKCGNFSTSCKPVSCSRRTLHHGVSKYCACEWCIGQIGADGRRAQLVVRFGRVHGGTMKTSGDVCEYNALGSINEITAVGW